jgi:hypothetical protein
MRGSAIRCADDRHVFETPSRYHVRDRVCSRCGLRLQCFRGKHVYDRREGEGPFQTCVECGKQVRRRARRTRYFGIRVNPRPY